MDPKVELAFARYKNGDHPWRVVKKEWFVADKSNELYPAKYIWALVINSKPVSFNTSDARRELGELDYSIVKVEHSKKQESKKVTGSPDSIEEKAKKVKGKPRRKMILIYDYERNPYVKEATLSRANGVCELCSSDAPFKRKKNKKPYLEVHHKIMLSQGGHDTLENTIAICPNCHREAHYG